MRKIPNNAIKIQEGLWAELVVLHIANKTINKYNLYSEPGYCFYEKQEDKEPLIIDGKIIEIKPIYYQVMYSAYSNIEQINENIISTSVQDEYNIV